MSDHSSVHAAAKAAAPVQVSPAPYVKIPLAATIFGTTRKAIECKIASGKWVEGRQYRRSPDGEIYISVKGVTAWIEGDKA